MAKDPYQTLGVPRTATREEIKRAFRKKARKHHPDVNPGDRTAEERFKEINAAYEVLSDAEKRKVYDELGEEAEKFGYDPEKAKEYRAWKESAERPPAGRARATPFEEGPIGFDFGDIFGDVFGGFRGRAPPRDRPTRGDDVSAEITISFVESIKGGQRELHLRKPAPCSACRGTGRRDGAQPPICPACKGTGRTAVSEAEIKIEVPCPQCGGTGRLPVPPCPVCEGTGEVVGDARITVTIPPGIREGQRIRVAGQGGPGRHGGPPGDLYLTVHVTPHPVFRRIGDDLELDLPVTVSEAMLGAEIEIPTMDGSVKLKVPPGSPTLARLRLRGKGVRRKNARAGDLYARIVVRVPDPSRDPAAARRAAEILDGLYPGDIRAELKAAAAARS
jgi:molecular chaperone DnaJ